MPKKFDFTQINQDILPFLLEYLAIWISDGKVEGDTYFGRIQPECDVPAGVYKISMKTGEWINALNSDKGNDIKSLLQYLTKQTDEWGILEYNSSYRYEKTTPHCQKKPT